MSSPSPQLNRVHRAAVRSERFAGFAAPTSNTTFTPNQFFDVCLPHSSRGVVRLVAYLIRQTLGWCDANGQPLHERVQVSYRELVEKAGISRGSIRKALDEALEGNFIECVRSGKASMANEQAISAQYQLRWSSDSEYVKDPARFKGFYEGEGNRTDIPNQFFDHVVPREPLAVIKVVGSIIRLSIGFQTQRGRRRQQVALSFRHIARYARLRDPHTLGAAIKAALENRYILRVQEGFFDPNAGKESRPAVFSLRWADSSPYFSTGSKTPAAFVPVNRFKNPSGSGSKSPAGNRFRNPSDIETKIINEIGKQQQADTPYLLLKGKGFSEREARRLSERHSQEEVAQQIEWLTARAPRRNPLGMLRRAIEENWPNPKLRQIDASDESLFARHFYAGLAGNPGLSVGEPSARDLEQSGQLIERLKRVCSTEVDLIGWARAFAGFVRERRSERDVTSLVLSLRLHGDAWLLHFTREREAQKTLVVEAQRQEHRGRYEKDWLRLIAEAESVCRASRPEAYNEFSTQVARNRWPAGTTDSERVRLLEFQRHFRMPDFWHWDAEFNPHPFSAR